MTQRIFTDRSRILQGQRCSRSRWWAYHAEGQGLAPGKTPLPLGVGSAVHSGLAVLVWEGQAAVTRDGGLAAMAQWLPFVEDAAVAAALADLTTYHAGGLELDTGEVAAQQQPTGIVTDADDMMRAQLAASLGMTVADAGLDALMTTSRNGRVTFDAYLWAEQCALVEAMVRAYARRRLRPLLEEFEVLEVEREGEWELVAVAHDWVPDDADDPEYSPTHCKFCGRRGHEDILASTLCYSLWFMSRPDALLRSRADDSLYILSFKTAASWDVRKAKDAEHDMQGLSEGVEVERRLQRWWEILRNGDANQQEFKEIQRSPRTLEWLDAQAAPPRILGIRMEFLLKGSRWKDKDLSARVGFDAWSQRSHLVRYYEATSVPKSKGEAAFRHGDRCWAWDYLRDDGTESHLAWQNWRSRAAWELPGGVKAWIDLLDASEMTMSAYDATTGQEPREVGWRSAAQALGYTQQHPLDACFVLPPMTIYRQDEELRDLVEQLEYAERRVAEGVAAVNAATDEGDRRSLLNQHFPMTRAACQFPSSCAYLPLCFGGEDLRAQPLNSGLYKIRVPNHPIEAELSTDAPK